MDINLLSYKKESRSTLKHIAKHDTNVILTYTLHEKSENIKEILFILISLSNNKIIRKPKMRCINISSFRIYSSTISKINNKIYKGYR